MTTKKRHSHDRKTVEPLLLILMRHAKSDWGNESLSDHDRPLNQRGIHDAPAMAQWLESVDAVPDIVLSSSALRTRQTIQHMQPIWESEPIITLSDSLYLAGPDAIVRTIQTESQHQPRVMVLGHNPGISQLASMFAGRTIDMPTSAVAAFRMTLPNWSCLSTKDHLELVDFMRPKAL